MRYNILPAHFVYVYVHVVTIHKHRIHAKKIFSFSSIPWHFLVDFVCNSARKSILVNLLKWVVILKLVCTRSCSRSLVPFGHPLLMLDPMQLMCGFPYSQKHIETSSTCTTPRPLFLPSLSLSFSPLPPLTHTHTHTQPITHTYTHNHTHTHIHPISQTHTHTITHTHTHTHTQTWQRACSNRITETVQ